MRSALFGLALLLSATPQPRPCAAQASPSTPIPSRDERFGIRSAVLGEDREVWVHLPTGAASGERFDVVYVLDGHALFPITAGEMDFRTNGSLSIFNMAGEPLSTWTFTNVWPSKWTASDLDVGSDDLMTEEVTLAVEELMRNS